ncbi:MAG: class I SAM-dependent methyltransferase [Pseudomonadota bacterium]|nr:class I SAM-dependent methyltransferase [Pseudomonadota bacterium]
MTPIRVFLPLACLLLPFAAGCSDRAPSPDTRADTAIANSAPMVAATEPPPTGATDATADADQPARLPDVIYVPTPEPVVDAMLNLAQVKPGDVLYDLGSGDGRIPIQAAKRFGVRATGIEIDPVRIREANANAEAAGVTGLVSFKQEDLFETDFSDATVVTLYLLDSLNERLRPRLLAELAPGTRIVSHAFRMGDWEPEQTVEVGDSTIFLWTVPAR